MAFVAGRAYEEQYNKNTFPVEMDSEMLSEWHSYLVARARGLV